MSKSTIKTKEMLYVFGVVLFAGLIRIPSLPQPLGPDQGIMSVIGEGILHGKLPYKDFWEMGSPAIFFTYALIFKLFGVSMAAIPITDILVSVLTTFLIFLLANGVWNKKVGYASALLFAFFSNGVRLGMHAGGDVAFGTFWYIAQRETFMLPLIVGSIMLLVRSQKNGQNLCALIMSGFLSGLAFVYKFPSMIILICMILYLNGCHMTSRKEEFQGSLIIKNVALMSGFILALVPFALFFLWKGAMNEMVNVVFRYVYSVYGQIDHNYLGIMKMGLIRTYFLAKENFILWIFFMTSSVYIIMNNRVKEHILMILWGAASLLFVVSHREFFGYHYLMVLPSFSILAGYGIVTALGPSLKFRQMFTREFGKVFIILSITANLVFFASLNFMHYTKFFYYVTGKITQDEYYRFFNAYPKHDYSFPSDFRVAKYISAHTSEEDMIYTLGGIESVIYFLAKRESPSRFIFSWIIFSDTHGRVKQAEKYRKELVADLEAKKPKYIVSVRALENFEVFGDIYNFVNDNYVLEEAFPDDRFVYVRNNRKGRSL